MAGGSAPAEPAARTALTVGATEGTVNDSLKSQITQLGLDYHIVTEYTSFVAVAEIGGTTSGANGAIDYSERARQAAPSSYITRRHEWYHRSTGS